MSMGLGQNFKIYDPQFWGGVIEVLQRETGVFNAESAGTIRMETRGIQGNFEKSSFLKYTGNLIQRRDVDDNTTDLVDINLQQGEFVGVKLNRVVGPVAMSRDAFKKTGFDPAIFSNQVGEQVGYEIAADYADSSISAVRAGIKGVTTLVFDNITGSPTGTQTLNNNAIVRAKFLFGDRAARIKAMVMHSKPYADLVGQAISDKVLNVADVVIYGGNVATLGLPCVVTDSPSLINTDASGNPTSYDVLLLTDGAVTLTESEERDVEMLPILGKHNLGMRLQAEHAFNLAVKGCAWDITNGGKNPTNSNLALATNWDQVVADKKSMPGVCLTVK